MIIKKEDFYTILITQKELDMIADSLSASVITFGTIPEEEHMIEPYNELLKILTPFTNVATGIERN